MKQADIYHMLIAIVPLLFSLSFHEAAHAWAARWRGDNTAALLGRLSLNPLKHIDWFGTIIFPMMALMLNGPLFGWAKPVPVNTRNLKDIRRDQLLIALAGPVSNIILAIAFTFVYHITVSMYGSLAGIDRLGLEFRRPLMLMLTYSVALNLALAFFNMLPIPPLDGSYILKGVVKEPLATKIDSLQQFGFLLLILLLISGFLEYLAYPIQAALKLLLGG